MSKPSQRSTDFDVIVVGARPAGAATAMLLARNGLRTVVVDRSAPGSDTLSTHALMRGAVLQLQRWGVLDVIRAAGTPPIRRTRFTYAESDIDISIKPSHGVDALYAPRRTLLDSTLVAAASAAGAEFRFGTTVRQLLSPRGRVAGVVTTDPSGTTAELTARLVIGADGLRSIVARLVGAEIQRQSPLTTACTYGYWRDVEVEGYHWVFRRNACSGAIPTNDGATCVFASATPDRIGAGGHRVIADIVAAGSPDLAAQLTAGTPLGGTRTWLGHPGFFRRAQGAGWALVGDAGYFKDPITAHGITDALRDAELLARAVVAGFGDDDTLAVELSEYEAVRNRLSGPLFDATEQIAGHEWNDDEIGGLLLNLSSSMAAEVDLLAGLDRVGNVRDRWAS